MRITTDCVGCGCCVSGIDLPGGRVCPVGAISLRGSRAEIDQGKCVSCGRCISFCGVGAIEEEEGEK